MREYGKSFAWIVFLLAGWGLFPGPLSADIIPSGSKPLLRCFMMDNLQKYPEYIIINHHESLLGGHMILTAGKCAVVDNKYNPIHLYALSRSAMQGIDIPTERTAEANFFRSRQNSPHTGVDIPGPDWIHEDDSLKRITYTLSIKELADNVFTVSKKAITYEYEDGGREALSYRQQDTEPAPSRPLKPIPSFAGEETSASGIFTSVWYFGVPAVALLAILVVYMKRRRQRSV